MKKVSFMEIDLEFYLFLTNNIRIFTNTFQFYLDDDRNNAICKKIPKLINFQTKCIVRYHVSRSCLGQEFD